MMEPVCDNCLFWKPLIIEEDGVGMCTRIHTTSSEARVRTTVGKAFLYTEHDFGCNLFEAKEPVSQSLPEGP